MTIDEMLTKYTAIYGTMMNHLNTIEDGHIPFGNVEGAPNTLDEARQGIMGLAFAAQQVVNDLLEIKMGLVYDEAEANEDSNLSVDN